MSNKILIGLPTGGSLSWEFFKSFMQCVNLLPEEGQCTIEFTRWQNIVKARNNIVKKVLSEDYTHLFFMDSDMSFPDNTLSRLLDHNLDIVGGLYCLKMPPYNTTIFKGNDVPMSEEKASWAENGNGHWGTVNPKAGAGILEVSAIGTGCLLIRRNVLEKMEWPYFWYEESPDEKEGMMTEDVVFCIKAKKAGFRIHCDTSILCGHVGLGSVTPLFKDDEFRVQLEML